MADEATRSLTLRCCGRSVSANHNVVLAIVLVSLYGAADAVWSGAVFAAYLKLINSDENTAVGYVEAASGVAGLLSALPVGYLADRYPRSLIVRFGGVCILLAAATFSAALLAVGDKPPADDSPEQRKYLVWFLAICALWGLGGGVVNGPVQALYADSTPPGERSRYYTYLFAAYTLSSCMGPAVTIVLFEIWGDDWSLSRLKNVILVGMTLEVVAASTMFFFDDKKSLKMKGGSSASSDGAAEGEEDVDVTDDPADESSYGSSSIQAKRNRIPYVLFTLDCIIAIGSGMTIKFFPLFFKESVGLSPSSVQIVYLCVPIGMVLASGVVGKVAKSIGRVQTIIIAKLSGLSFLYMMVFIPNVQSKAWAIIPIYIMRTSLMNSTYPLQESILMDFVKKDVRARWKSLESISEVGWAGSAVLGGFLSDRYSYSFTFLITAVIQTCGALGYFLLIPLVPKDERQLAEDRKRAAKNRRSADGGESITEPLLATRGTDAEDEREDGKLRAVV